MANRPKKSVLWLVIVAAPVALAFETALRKLLFPADFELVREFLRPTLTPVAWGLAGVAGLAALAGLLLQRRLVRARLARVPAELLEVGGADVLYREAFAVFLITSSVPQIPSILSTFTFMFGASLVPVLVSLALSSVGVVAQVFRVERLAGEATSVT